MRAHACGLSTLDRSGTGLAQLVSLPVYSFVAGVTIDGEAEGDEVFVIIQRGAADLAIRHGNQPAGDVRLQAQGGARALYMPPHAAYRLNAITDCDIAYARAQPRQANCPAPAAFAPHADRLDIVGHATGMDLAFAVIAAGEPIALAHSGTMPERIVHLRAGAEPMRATLAGEPLEDWDTVALDAGESVRMQVVSGTADILTISA